MIGNEEIRELIPHSGSMCLLDEVKEWDEKSIVCLSNTHRDSANPLRRNNRLSAVHAFEYGAQATAVHGGLCARSAGGVAPPGYLAALRDASLRVARLDDLASPLEVRARRLFGNNADCVYQCQVFCGGVNVAEGRVTIILRPPKSAQTNQDRPGKESGSFAAESEIVCAISSAHPSLPGHFPGDPIVPGVVVLDEVIACLAASHRIDRIHSVKFLRPLLPAQAFTISFATKHSGQISFQCRVKDQLMVEGRLEVASYV